MADIEAAKKALINADKAGDVEGARKLAQYIQSQEPREPQGSGSLGFMNRSIAQGLGAPVDLVTAGLNKAGMNIQSPVGGSESFTRLFESIGSEVASPEERAETLPQQVAQGVGDAASMLLPIGAGAKIAQKGSGAINLAAQKGMETLGRKGLAVPAMEVAAGGGAGVGGYTAEQFTDNPYVKMGGQLIGGGATQPLIALSRAPTKLATKGVKAASKPFTIEGGKTRAKKRIQELVPKSEVDSVIKSLDDATISDLTPAQKSAQPKLLALEKEVMKRDFDIDSRFAERSKNNTHRLTNEIINIRGGGNIQAAKEFSENRVARLSQALNARTQQAVDVAESKVAKLRPEMRESQASVVIANELEKALKAARTQENQLWQALPDVDIDVSKSKEVYKNLYKNTPKAQREDIPKIANTFLKQNGVLGKAKWGNFKVDNIKEVQGLRSKLLEEARRSRADGNYNKARISNELADSLLEDMTISEGGKELQEAILYSRELNRKFTQGTVGKLLGSDKTGTSKVPSELTLQAALGAGKERGFVGMEDILKASDTPETRFAMENYLKQNFQREAIKDGIVNPKAAQKFIANNKDILDKTPQFRNYIGEAIDSSNALARQQIREKAINANILSNKKSAASKFLNTTLDKEFDAIAGDKNPAVLAKQLKRQAAKDGTGEATKGLKAGAIDYLMNKSKLSTIDAEGQQMLSGRKMLNMINKKSKEYKAIRPFLKDGEIQRLRTIAGELIKLEKTATPDIGRIIQDTPNSILSTMARVVGAQVGGKLGAQSAGGSLQTAAIFSGRAKDFVENSLKSLTTDKAEVLLMEAVQDPQLMKALLAPMKTTSQQKMVNQRLNAWLAAVDWTPENKEEQ